MAGDDRVTPIADLRPGFKNVNCIFIVIDNGSKQQTKDGSLVRKCRVADRTGSIIFSIWNDEAEAIETGDIIKLTRGYSSVWKGSLVLYCGKYGIVEKLGEFTMVYSESPDMSIQTESTSPHSTPPSNSYPSGRSNQHTSNDVSTSTSEGRSQPTPLLGNRNENNHITQSYTPPSSDIKDLRIPKDHNILKPHQPSLNGRQHISNHDNTKYSDRRTQMHSHDSHMTASNRHHPYPRHSMNGRR